MNKESHKISCRKYEKTPNGFLMRMYRNMKSRILGIQKAKRHLYEGKYLLPKEEFYEWAKNSPQFMVLFDKWVKSGYDRKLSPSVDRIDSSKGYTIENMEWVTHSENSRRGTRNKFVKLTEQQARDIKYNLPHLNNTQAGKVYKVSSTMVSAIRSGASWTHI